jgi:hypothetical protein
MPKAKSMIILISGIVGLFVSLYGLYSAIFRSSQIWYSFFTVGSFLFFASVSYWLRKDSSLNSVLRKAWLLGLLYLVFLGITVLVEFYGRFVGSFWTYPYFDQGELILHVYLLGYPFAFLSVIPLFEIVEHLILSGISGPSKPAALRPPQTLYRLLCAGSAVIFVSSLVTAYFVEHWTAEFNFMAMIAGALGLDLVRTLVHQRSFIERILSGDYRYAIIVPLASWVAAFLHEVPNTFANEWIYHNVPFTDRRIFGVNAIVFIVGWLFLTVVPVTIFRLLDDASSPAECSSTLGEGLPWHRPQGPGRCD